MEKDMYGFQKQRSGAWRSSRDGDFQEEDVWAVLDDHQNYSSPNINHIVEPAATIQSSLSSAARMIPRTTSSASSSCCSMTPHEDRGVMAMRQSSAPVNVPDWSTICTKKQKKVHSKNHLDHDINDYGEDDECDEKVSPHEYFLARSQSSSFSVIEGVGRTLKGRDLSKVRNAVLKKTGFLE